MRIDRNQALKVYETAKNLPAAKAEHAAAPANAANTDRVSISSEAARQAGLSGAVQHIAAEVEAGVGSAKLQQLAAQIEAGQYRVPTQQLAASMLKLSD